MPAVKGDDLPAAWPPHLKGRAVDQDAIARRRPGWRRSGEPGPAVWTDRQRSVARIQGVAGKCESALRTRGINVIAKQSYGHGPALHPAENREPLDKPRAKSSHSYERKQDDPFYQVPNTATKQGLGHGSLDKVSDCLIVTIHGRNRKENSLPSIFSAYIGVWHRHDGVWLLPLWTCMTRFPRHAGVLPRKGRKSARKRQ